MDEEWWCQCSYSSATVFVTTNFGFCESSVAEDPFGDEYESRSTVRVGPTSQLEELDPSQVTSIGIIIY
jgi:hypothetical protein